MKTRDRAYYRDVRARKIAHRKRIVEQYYGWPYYPEDGYYSKGKIHCSCGMCKEHTRNKNYHRRHISRNFQPNLNYKPSDKRKIERLIDQLDEDYELQQALQQDIDSLEMSLLDGDIDIINISNLNIENVSLDDIPLWSNDRDG